MEKQILILGAGYAGLVCALQARKHLTKADASITLVNKHDYHQLITLLHESAVGARSDRSLRVPFHRVLRNRDVAIHKATVTRIEPDRKRVILENGGVLSYDLLVVALGSETEYFDIPGLKEHAFTLRGCSKRGQNSPAHCRVSAKNAPSRTKNVRSVRILGSLPCTARVLPDPFLNRLYLEVVQQGVVN